MTAPLEDLRGFLAKNGFDYDPVLSEDYQRFDRGGRSQNAWVKLSQVKVGENVIYSARIGDWSTGEKLNWQSNGVTLTQDQQIELTLKLEAAKIAEQAAKKAQQDLTAQEAVRLWAGALTRGTTEYLEKKKLKSAKDYGFKIDPEKPGNLWVPLFNIHGDLRNIQKILPDGSKYFMPGGEINGNFCTVGPYPIQLENLREYRGDVYVSEGPATAASIYECLRERLRSAELAGEQRPCYVLSAFNAGNLKNVCRELRQAAPHCQITICADHDRWTARPHGDPYNPGVEAALEAARLCHGRIAVADIVCTGHPGDRPSDFNDLHQRSGLPEVLRQILSSTTPEKFAIDRLVNSNSDPEPGLPGDPDGIEPGLKGPGTHILPIPSWIDPEGKKHAPTHQKIADTLLDHFGNNLVKHDRDLWEYRKTHWEHLNRGDLDNLKVMIQRLCGGRAKSKDLNSIYDLFILHVPSAPLDPTNHTSMILFPNPYTANFLNGTLHIQREARGSNFILSFHNHNRTDYLTSVLPYHYDPDDQTTNPEFLAMLDRVFQGDGDKSDKIRAVQQMFGGCLLQAWPHCFMLYGPPKTGKSTVLKIAARLVDHRNVSRVPPSKLNGFNMESMPGKLVNIDTDIPFNTPIQDDVIKKLVDRVPFPVNRKGLRILEVPLPGIHLWGGNDIPRALDGAARAFDRRITFIGFDRVVQDEGNANKEYADYCYEMSPQGILNFAIQGLLDLLKARGVYHNPPSGVVKSEEWQAQSDLVGQFLSDVDAGEVLDENRRVIRGPGAKVERKTLWAIFDKWQKDNCTVQERQNKIKTFDTLQRKGISVKLFEGVHYFHGIGLQGVKDSGF